MLVAAFQREVQRRAPLRVVRAEPFEPLTEFANDPVGFCREVLGVELWETQQEIALALLKYPRVSVAACYASGKSFLAACIVVWWMYTRCPALVITTAPTTRQVKNILWAEIRKLVRKAKRSLPGRLLTDRLDLSDLSDQTWKAMGFSGSGANTRSGLHAEDNVLFVEDEAAGMEADAIDDFEGLLTTEHHAHLKIGNPVCADGPFWDSHMDPDEKKRWKRVNISALRTPNYLAGKPVVRGLVSKEWVELRRQKWGESSPLWKMKVLGQFYQGIGDKVIPKTWIDLAKKRWGTLEEGEPRILGVDIAVGGRDETALYLRAGRVCKFVDAWQIERSDEQKTRIIAIAKAYRVSLIRCDRNGPGKGVFDFLRLAQEQGEMPGIELEGINPGASAKDKEQFDRCIDEVHWACRWAFDPDNPEAVAIDPADTELAEELNIRGWRITQPAHRIKVESKNELISRGVTSPDRAEALMLTFSPRAKDVVFFVV